MARKRHINIGATPKRGQILALSSYQNTSVAPVEKMDDSPIIPYFKEDGNSYPKLLVDMFERGGIHRACIYIKHRLACGDGIIIARKDGQPYEKNVFLEDWLQEVNPNQSAYKIMCDQLLDSVLFNMLAGQVSGEKQGTTVYHEDISTVRWGKLIDGKLENAYISNMWGEKELKKPDVKSLAEYAEQLPLFVGQSEPSLLIVKNYQPGRKYYPVPDYYSLSVKGWIDLEYKIPTYNNSNIDNKFMPSGILNIYGEPPADLTPQQYISRVMDSLTGEGNNSKVLVQMLANKESASDFTPLNTQPDGIFINLDTLAQQSILRAHRMHPMLLMATAGSLGQGNELKTILDWYYASVIKGYQDMVIEFWDRILKHAGFGEYTLSIANNNPVSLLNSLDISKFLSVNEIRKLLGYDPLADDQSNEKTLAEIIGVGGIQSLTALMADPNLKTEQKRGALEVLFGLDLEQIDKLVPLTPTL